MNCTEEDEKKLFDPYIAVRKFSAFSEEENCFHVKGFHRDKDWFYKVLLEIKCQWGWKSNFYVKWQDGLTEIDKLLVVERDSITASNRTKACRRQKKFLTPTFSQEENRGAMQGHIFLFHTTHSTKVNYTICVRKHTILGIFRRQRCLIWSWSAYVFSFVSPK